MRLAVEALARRAGQGRQPPHCLEQPALETTDAKDGTIVLAAGSSVLSVRAMESVTPAGALGAGAVRLMARHVLTNALAPVIVYGAIRVGIVIAAEATLSYLGLGLQLPAISWGLMVATAQPRLLSAPHLLLFPGLFLSVTVLAFILLGDALRDAFDPRLR